MHFNIKGNCLGMNFLTLFFVFLTHPFYILKINLWIEQLQNLISKIQKSEVLVTTNLNN